MDNSILNKHKWENSVIVFEFHRKVSDVRLVEAENVLQNCSKNNCIEDTELTTNSNQRFQSRLKAIREKL
jgi:hypothetical protein